MRRYVLALTLLCLSAFAGVDSSIDIPADKHQKYTLSKYRSHPTVQFEGERYLASLAKISKEDVERSLSKEGLNASTISLLDLHRELVYQVYAQDADGKKYRLYVDAGNGKVLERQGI